MGSEQKTKRRQRKPVAVPGAPVLLDSDDFCAANGFGREVLRRLVKEGRVQPIRIGQSMVRYRAEDVGKFGAPT